MKKAFKFLIFVFVAYSAYHFYKCKGTISSLEKNEYEKQKSQIEELKKQVDSLYQFSHELAFNNSKYADKISALRDTIEILDASNTFLIEQINQKENNSVAPKENNNQLVTNNKTVKKKNEKSIPIARNDRALQLQKFFSDRYSDK